MNIRNSVGLTLFSGLWFCSPSLHGGAVVGATEFTQIANNFELAGAYTEQINHTIQQQEMLRNQLKSFELQLQNVKQLDGVNWNAAVDVLNRLGRVVKTTNGLGYALATQDEAFKALHRDYAKFESEQPENAQFTKIYRDWSQYNADAAVRASAAAGITLEQAESEASRIAALKAAGSTAEGQLQAITAGNALAGEMLDQVRVLNRLTAVQIDAQARYQLIEQEKANRNVAHDSAAMDEQEEPDPNAKAYGEMK